MCFWTWANGKNWWNSEACGGKQPRDIQENKCFVWNSFLIFLKEHGKHVSVVCSVFAFARHIVNKIIQKKNSILCSVEYLSTANAIKINTSVLVSKPTDTGRNCYLKQKDNSVTRLFTSFVMTLIPTKCRSGYLWNHVCLGEKYSKRAEK